MDITKLFLDSVKDNAEFAESLDIIRLNSRGNHWFIGSFVFRNIAAALYGLPNSKSDIDVIIENPVNKLNLPGGWMQSKTSYGNPRFYKSDLIIDFVTLQNISSILRRGLEPTIENYLTGTPFTIQSIAFDVKQQKIIGDVGVQALLNKTIAVNDLEEAKIRAEHKGQTVDEMLSEKAEDLSFKIITS